MGKKRGRRSVPEDPTTIKNVRLDELFLRPLPTDMTKESFQHFVSQSGFLFKEIRLFVGSGNRSAFIRFHCDSDASRALTYFQNVVLDGKALRVRYTVDYYEDNKQMTEKCNEGISKVRMAFSWIDKHCRTYDDSRLPKELAGIKPQYYKGPRQLGGLMKERCDDKHPECTMFESVYRQKDKVQPSYVTLPDNEVCFEDLGAKIKVLQSKTETVNHCRPFSMVDQFRPRAKEPAPSTPTKGFGRGRIKQRLSSPPPLTPIKSPQKITQKTPSSITNIINTDVSASNTVKHDDMSASVKHDDMSASVKHDDMSSSSSGIFSDADVSDTELPATTSDSPSQKGLTKAVDAICVSLNTREEESSINECGVSPKKGLGRGAGVLQLVRNVKLLKN